MTSSSEAPELNCEPLVRYHPALIVPSQFSPLYMLVGNIFYQNLTQEHNSLERGNFLISPFGMRGVLTTIYQGARGDTAFEIWKSFDNGYGDNNLRRTLMEWFYRIQHSVQYPDDRYEVKVGVNAFIDQTAEVYTSYQCKLKTYYNSDIVKVDFSNPSAAVKVINNWAKNVTEGHIHDLISESEAQSSTIMLLLNAVYFKGQWEVPFPANQTRLGTFHLDEKNTVTVPFMNVTGRFDYFDLPQCDAHILQLRYKATDFAFQFSMYVLLPHKTTGLDYLISTLGPELNFEPKVRKLQTTVNLVMPKFEFDFTTKMRPTLEKLNIKTMFSSEAELVDIAKTKGKRLVVSNVLQKAKISVTEVGSVDYAATAHDLLDKFGGTEETVDSIVDDLTDKFGGTEETVDFIVDRPFLFVIDHRVTRTPVLVGKVTNPFKT